jgi:hypothetical protein
MDCLITAAILITRDGYWISGAVSTQGRRLLDLLNDGNRKQVRLQDVEISVEPGFTRSSRRQEAVIQKEKLGLAILAQKEHESAAKRWDHYTPKRRLRVGLLALGLEIEGDLHLGSSSSDIQNVLVSTSGSFLPLTDVRISPMDAQGEPFQAGVVLINKEVITLLGKLQEEPQKSWNLAQPKPFTASDPILSPEHSTEPRIV